MHQPHSSRVKLPGTLWGIVTYFNPAGYPNKIVNFRLFRASLRKQGLPLVAVEAVMGDTEHELQDDDAERVIRVRATAVLWQKERLYNIALQHLPPDCDKVVWLDGDVLFGNDGWIGGLSDALEHAVIVQPFEQAVQLPKGVTRVLSAESPAVAKNSAPSSIAWWLSNRCPRNGIMGGHCGYACAARRSFLDAFGFYDHGIAGSGDAIMMGAFFGIEPRLNRYVHLDHCLLLDHAAGWSSRVADAVRGDVRFIPGTAYHLWHGSRQNRFYVERGALLTDFDPDHDIVIDAQGCFAWATDKPNLHARVRSYFWMRDEEADETSLAHMRLSSLEEQVLHERGAVDSLRQELERARMDIAGLRALTASCPGPILLRLCKFLDLCSTLILPRHSRLRRMVRTWFLPPNSL